jgi:hypothetical protein
MPEPAVEIDHVGNDLRFLLDRELERLPQKYRVALVLCDLEGRGRRETARQLGLAEGTLSSRLATGRRLLAKRLSRRGLTLSGGLLAALLAEHAQAAVPVVLAKATFLAAVKLSAGQALASLGVSTGVLTTFKGVMQTMLLTKLKLLMSFVLAVGMVGGLLGSAMSAGGLQISSEAAASDKANRAAVASREDVFADHLQSRSWTLKGLNLEQRTITICDRPNRATGGLTLVLGGQNGVVKPPDQKGAVLEGLQLAPEAKVLIDGRTANLTDLKVGMTLLLKIAKGKTQISAIQAVTQSKEDQYFVEAVDLKKNTITVRVNNTTAELPLGKGAKMIVEMVPPGVNQAQTVESPVTDIARGTPVHLQMGVEGERLVIRSLKISQ